MIECSKCVMNDTIREFSLNSKGVCNFCEDWEKKKDYFTNFTDEQIKKNLNSIKSEIKKFNKKNNYDCIIGLSGGTDSSYVVYLAFKMKLKPLIIHMDNGWNSKISNSNINKILEKTNFDYKTLILNWKEFKDLQISFLKAGVPDIEILTNRSLDKTDDSNRFIQMSLHTQETNNKDRLITNLGYGYRELTDDNSLMYGANAFIDIESEGHMRASLGLEAKGKILDLNANFYEAISGKENIDGMDEEVLSGYQFNLTTQMPYMPWSTLNIQNYYFENIKASNDTEGNKISLEMNLTPTLQFDISQDFSDTTGVDDETDFKLSLRYPPTENKPNLQDGFISNVAFEKANMKDKLVQKVRRDNNLTVEIQGAVILTKK